MSNSKKPGEEPIAAPEDLPEDPWADLDDDDELNDFADEANDPRAIDLEGYQPRPIGTRAPGVAQPSVLEPLGMSRSDFWEQDEVVGRPTSPPIWEHQHLHPNVVQLRVWVLQDGIPVLCGIIDATANEEEFVRKFSEEMPKPGEGTKRFKIRPLDINGREILTEIMLNPISEHHTVLKKIRAAAAAGGTAAAPSIDFSPLNRALDLIDRRSAMQEEDARASRERERDFLERMAEERVQLAERASRATEGLAERFMGIERSRSEHQLEMERQRAQEHQAAIASAFSQLQQQAQAQWTQERESSARRSEEDERRWRRRMEEDEEGRRRERDEAEERRHRERLELEARIAKEREEMRDRREQERRDWEERIAKREAEERRRTEEQERERQRQHEMRLKELERQDVLRREEAERRERQEREYNARMMELTLNRQHDDTMEGTIEKFARVAKMFGVEPGDIKDWISGARDEDGGVDWTAVLSVVPGALQGTVESIAKAIESNNRSKQPLITQMPGAAPTAPPPGLSPAGPGGPTQAQPAGPPAQGESGRIPDEVANPAADAGLTLETQKNARKALRALVQQLRQKPQSEWETIIGVALVSEGAIYHYCKAMTLRQALSDAGADDKLIDAFISSPAGAKIDADVPRG